MKRILMTMMVAFLAIGMATAQTYTTGYSRFHKRFKVKGGAGIEQFVRALNIYDEEEGDKIMDKNNGYFHVFYEGGGSSTYTATYWNRKDGKKMLILSYKLVEELEACGDKKEYLSPWYYTKICTEFLGDEGDIHLRYDIGFVAYIYNAGTHELVPMSTVPITGWTKKKAFRTLVLPQSGKNITVKEGNPSQKQTTYTLKWNGTTFRR